MGVQKGKRCGPSHAIVPLLAKGVSTCGWEKPLTLIPTHRRGIVGATPNVAPRDPMIPSFALQISHTQDIPPTRTHYFPGRPTQNRDSHRVTANGLFQPFRA
uniref:Uncharacterized protein n=1 Tax=Sphaerodactylus townsendi TaxID=933632 RepID=A0ACB8FK73_9SAUR